MAETSATQELVFPMAGPSAPPAAVSLQEAALARRLQAREPSAAAEAWSRYGLLVARIVRRFLGPGPDQQDLRQEIFLRFFARIDELHNPNALRNFLIGICLGVARNEARRAKFRRLVGLTADGELPELGAVGWSPEARETTRALYRVLQAASAEDRSLFVTRYMETMELTDVAAVHGISLATAKRRLARATHRIAARMKSDPALSELVQSLTAGKGVHDVD